MGMPLKYQKSSSNRLVLERHGRSADAPWGLGLEARASSGVSSPCGARRGLGLVSGVLHGAGA